MRAKRSIWTSWHRVSSAHTSARKKYKFKSTEIPEESAVPKTLDDEELQKMYDQALVAEAEAPHPQDYRTAFKKPAAKTTKKPAANMTKKPAADTADLEFDLKKATEMWTSKYMECERSPIVRKRAYSTTYHKMFAHATSQGISSVDAKEQAQHAARAAIEHWLAAA